MTSDATTYIPESPPWDLSKWRNLPVILIVGGLVLAALAGLAGGDLKHFGYSYLMAYIFFLSLCLGSLFLVLIHHLFDAGWSVPIRRFCEHTACLLFPAMAVLWIPIGLLAPKIYPWMGMAEPDHALRAKQALLNKPMWYGISIIISRLGYPGPWAAPLVVEAGRNGGGHLHLQNALLFLLGNLCFRVHLDTGDYLVGQNARARMVLDHVRGLLFCGECLDHAGHSLCDYRRPEADRSPGAGGSHAAVL
jgi:hypothetical protein